MDTFINLGLAAHLIGAGVFLAYMVWRKRRQKGLLMTIAGFSYSLALVSPLFFVWPYLCKILGTN